MSVHRLLVSVGLLFVWTALSSGTALHAKEMTELRIVVQDIDGEPVARASVVVGKIKGPEKRKVKGKPLQLKTSLEGSAPLPPLPQGWYMLQVISDGYQTFGDSVELTEEEQTITVTLKDPKRQFSVHTDK